MLAIEVDGTCTTTSAAPLPRITAVSLVDAALPGAHGMLATVPVIGARSETALRFLSASLSATSAADTAAVSSVMRAAVLVVLLLPP
jgi:hypothetical protein